MTPAVLEERDAVVRFLLYAAATAVTEAEHSEDPVVQVGCLGMESVLKEVAASIKAGEHRSAE